MGRSEKCRVKGHVEMIDLTVGISEKKGRSYGTRRLMECEIKGRDF